MFRLLISWLMILCWASQATSSDLNVFAAASLKGTLDDIALAFKAKAGTNTVITYAASNTLAKQIEQAAPADVFISADEAWMDALAEKKLIKPDTRHDVADNTLVCLLYTSPSPRD